LKLYFKCLRLKKLILKATLFKVEKKVKDVNFDRKLKNQINIFLVLKGLSSTKKETFF